MPPTPGSPNRVASLVAARLRAARTELTARWLERILARVDIPPGRVFPSDELLDHIPMLLLAIADVIEDPARTPAGDSQVISHARELGALRHAQGFGESEILKEFHLLGGILFTFVERVAAEPDGTDAPAQIVACTHRLFDALSLIQETTATHYLGLTRQRVLEREDRLRSFNRMLTHEFRNRIGAALGAADALADLSDLGAAERTRLARVARNSVHEMANVLEGLLDLTHGEDDVRQQRHVRLPEAAREAARQLRHMAEAARVRISVRSDLPDVEVNAAAVELCLANLIGNAIKYSDRGKDDRWVDIRGRMAEALADGARHVVIEVADNGVGVPHALRASVFERFVRADDAPEGTGTGLGLNIAREAVERLGGRIWLEDADEGAIFAFSLPARRRDDAPLAVHEEGAAGTTPDH
jgi:signal transduction histidine kinase